MRGATITAPSPTFTEAISRNPDLAEAYANRGHALVMTRNLDGGLADYNKAIALNPKFAEAYNGRSLQC
jgi:tetratricopeptide (TPR) repeat protein